MLKKAIMLAAILSMASCTATDVAKVATGALGSKDGIEATAQVGTQNQKGLINTSQDKSKEIDIKSVAGDSNVDSGNVSQKQVNNSGYDMLLMVLAGALPPLFLLLYFVPSPRWLARRHAEFCSKEHPDEEGS